jgi:hypothetical protein
MKKPADQVKAFVESVNIFFAEVESWIASSSLKSIRQEIEISEYSGAYKVSKLMLQDASGKKIVEFIPVGAFIIGGRGRIDMNGTIDKAIIVNLGEVSLECPYCFNPLPEGQEVCKMCGGYVESYPAPLKTALYKDIDKEGWYWIRPLSKVKFYPIKSSEQLPLLKEVY